MMDDHSNSIVCPMLIPRESQLANVDDVFNGIMVRGDATGDVVFYAKGANCQIKCGRWQMSLTVQNIYMQERTCFGLQCR